MAHYAKDLVNQAKAWLGCNEADGSHKKIIDVYNSHKPLARGYKLQYDDAWCSGFVSACAIKCGMTDIIPTEVGCPPHVALFVSMGIWVENDAYVPRPGDIIFYDWDDNGVGDNTGSADHVGIVEMVSGGYITVIEGNCSNAVKRRVIAVNARYIRGYGVPKYDVEKATSALKSIDTIAREVIAGSWGNGADRHERLVKAGYDYDKVQERVGEILNAPKKKSVDEIAKEVIAGAWGNGSDRKNRLTKAGYDYDAVQSRVNALLNTKSVNALAKEVIAGKWGNGADRKARLTKAGYDYDKVQAEVNRLLG